MEGDKEGGSPHAPARQGQENAPKTREISCLGAQLGRRVNPDGLTVRNICCVIREVIESTYLGSRNLL